MRISLGELRKVVRSALLESTLPNVWWHGSPYSFSSMHDFEQPIVFLTDSRRVAEEYTRELVGSGHRRPGAAREARPTLYRMRLLLPTDDVFDTCRPEHQELFVELARESRQRFGEDGFSKNDVMDVPAAHGSSIRGRFPSFGITMTLLDVLGDRGMFAAIVGEGTQGASLAVSVPRRNVELLSSEEA